VGQQKNPAARGNAENPYGLACEVAGQLGQLGRMGTQGQLGQKKKGEEQERG
jgi:hypothetical protein